VPISGLFGTNIKDPVEPKVAPWYKGGTLFSVHTSVLGSVLTSRVRVRCQTSDYGHE